MNTRTLVKRFALPLALTASLLTTTGPAAARKPAAKQKKAAAEAPAPGGKAEAPAPGGKAEAPGGKVKPGTVAFGRTVEEASNAAFKGPSFGGTDGIVAAASLKPRDPKDELEHRLTFVLAGGKPLDTGFTDEAKFRTPPYSAQDRPSFLRIRIVPDATKPDKVEAAREFTPLLARACEREPTNAALSFRFAITDSSFLVSEGTFVVNCATAGKNLRAVAARLQGGGE
jgi:hypothetical protein